jgi:hypothetical protein
MATNNSSNATNVNHCLIIGTGSAYTSLANGTTGQFLGANTGADPSWQSVSSGKLIQTVTNQNTTYTTVTSEVPLDNTKPQITEGTEILTVTFTPTSSTNILTFNVTMSGTCVANRVAAMSLFQSGNSDALCTTVISFNAETWAIWSLNYAMTAGTTSSSTFSVRIGCNAGGSTVYINGSSGGAQYGGAMAAQLIVNEIVP